jgi:hypothetical protein
MLIDWLVPWLVPRPNRFNFPKDPQNQSSAYLPTHPPTHPPILHRHRAEIQTARARAGLSCPGDALPRPCSRFGCRGGGGWMDGWISPEQRRGGFGDRNQRLERRLGFLILDS